MALIKPITLATGESGDYWRIVEVNDHAERGSVATLQLYKSRPLREQSAQPMALSLQFVFELAELDDIDADETLPTDWRDVWYHVHYMLIKAAIESGAGKAQEDMTANEMTARILEGATDDF
jgi:hypothetical protein